MGRGRGGGSRCADPSSRPTWTSLRWPERGWRAGRVAQVQEALSLAYDSHSGQMRKSGEKYITHPVEVTRILAELQMDHESLIAGLLHDTVEDTQFVCLEEIGVRQPPPPPPPPGAPCRPQND